MTGKKREDYTQNSNAGDMSFSRPGRSNGKSTFAIKSQFENTRVSQGSSNTKSTEYGQGENGFKFNRKRKRTNSRENGGVVTNIKITRGFNDRNKRNASSIERDRSASALSNNKADVWRTKDSS